MIAKIVIIAFILLEASNVLALYFAPGSKRANAVGVFSAWEKSKQYPEIHDFVKYLVYWVAGAKLIFLFLLGGIARLAHTTIVVEAPGMGDDIQAIKAGILEIADILVVNKADKTGVEHTERALRAMLELARPEKMPYTGSQHPPQHEELDENEWWMPPVLRVIATEGAGIREVAQAIRDHGEFLRHTGLWVQRDRERLESELQTLIRSVLMYRWRRGVSEDLYQDVLTRLVERSLSPYQAVDELVGMPVE